MQKMILTLLFCSVVTFGNSDDENKANGILTKTLTEVKSFKKEKNEEIQMLKTEIMFLRKKLSASKIKQQQEIKKVKKKLVVSQNKVLKYKKFEIKVNKKLKENKETIKDLHFMIKHKNKAEMDEYALGRYYFNL